MDLRQNLSLKQEQKLSPQMLQSLALLPLTSLELKNFIQTEIENNPALEIPETESDYTNSEQHENNNFDINDEDSSYYENASYLSKSENDPDVHNQVLENSSHYGESLSEHLTTQLGLLKTDNTTLDIGQMLIGNLNADGFYILPLETLFERTSYRKQDIEKTVEIIQGFDPYGICCKDFRESLIVQAKCSGMQKDDIEIFSQIVNQHLERLKNGKFREVSSMLHISEEDLETFFSILKSFNPHPGLEYGSDSDNLAVPEFSIHQINGELILEMNRTNMPDLRISAEFSKFEKNPVIKQDKETLNYINNCIKQANNLIAQVDMRYKTLYNTAAALMKLQKDFFLSGPDFLKPMVLNDVALEVGVHETTISRISQSKWLETDWGLFQMKDLFTQGVKSEEGTIVSRNVVKDMIASILAEEPKLSDQKISDKLLEKGIKCARRTVSKYRAELNIDSSFRRS